MKQRSGRRAPASSSVEAAQLAEPASNSNPVELPEAVLTRILQHIPLWERFDSCALVSQQWAAAAAAATTDIDTVIEDYEKHGVKAGKCDRMSAWLKQHGAHVTSIKLENSFGHSCDDVLVFPCEKLLNLQRLVLHGFEVQLETADSAAAATAGSAAAAAAGGGGREGAAAPDCHKHSVQDAQQGQRSRSCSSSKGSAAKGGAAAAAVLLPRLQELQLVHCELAAGTLELLPSLPSLSKLLFTDSRKDGISTALPQLLHQLPALQDLQFVCAGVPERGLDPVSTLQRLQRLSLAVPYGQDLGVLARMPAGLTGLVLTADPFYKPAEGEELEWIGLVQLPLLQGLTALRHLEIKDLLIQPSRLLTLDPSAMTHLQLDNVIGRPAEDGPALMIALQHLTNLQHLQLFDNFWQTPLAPQQFSALTASGGLTALLVMDRSLQPLPQGAVQHLLPAGKRMQHLRLLSLSSGRAHGGSPSGEAAALLDSQHWCLDSKDINSITNSCPALQSLCLCHVVRPTADLRSLSRLGTTLETLAVAGAAFKLGAARAVAQLTNLQTLTWCDSPLADAGLRQFTALTALTKLELHNCKLSQKLVNVPSGFGRVRSMAGIGKTTEFMLHKFAPSVPPIWQHLQDIFAALDAGSSKDAAGSSKGSKQNKTAAGSNKGAGKRKAVHNKR